jgi:hypothetical protein
MTTDNDNHDPFAQGGDQQVDDDATLVKEQAAVEFEPLSEEERLGWYESLSQPKWG